MEWDKVTRQRYMISYWHILEALLKRQQAGYGTSAKNVQAYFRIPEVRAYMTLGRLEHTGLIRKEKSHKRVRLNTEVPFVLSDRALEMLESQQIDSFLDPRNKHLDKSYERAEKLGKEFIHEV